MIEILAALVLGALYVLALWADEVADQADDGAQLGEVLDAYEVLPPCLT